MEEVFELRGVCEAGSFWFLRFTLTEEINRNKLAQVQHDTVINVMTTIMINYVM